MPARGKAPDVLIHDTDRDWLIVIEAVTSHGPIDQKRKNELTALFASAHPGLVFVTAFKDHKAYSRYHVSLAWETEAWVAGNSGSHATSQWHPLPGTLFCLIPYLTSPCTLFH